MATKVAKRSTATNNPELGKPMIPLDEHFVLDGIKAQGEPVIVQVKPKDDGQGKPLGVIRGAKTGTKTITDPNTGEKVKVPTGGHSYKAATPRRTPDLPYVKPKVFVDGKQQASSTMAARAITDENKGKNVCARHFVTIDLAGRTATRLTDEQQVTLTEGFLHVIVKDRTTGANPGEGTIQHVGVSPKAQRTGWNC